MKSIKLFILLIFLGFLNTLAISDEFSSLKGNSLIVEEFQKDDLSYGKATIFLDFISEKDLEYQVRHQDSDKKFNFTGSYLYKNNSLHINFITDLGLEISEDWKLDASNKSVSIFNSNANKYFEYKILSDISFLPNQIYQEQNIQNFKGAMKCRMLYTTELEITDGIITKFSNTLLSTAKRTYSEWKIDDDKTNLDKLIIHVKAINRIANQFENFIFDFKNYSAKMIDFGGFTLNDQCEKKLQL